MVGIQESLDANKKWALHFSTRTTFVNQEVKTLKQSSTEQNTRLNDLEQVTSALGFDVQKAIASISSLKTQVSPSGGSVQYLEEFFDQDDYNYYDEDEEFKTPYDQSVHMVRTETTTDNGSNKTERPVENQYRVPSPIHPINIENNFRRTPFVSMAELNKDQGRNDYSPCQDVHNLQSLSNVAKWNL